jgi:hypothetical protein
VSELLQSTTLFMRCLRWWRRNCNLLWLQLQIYVFLLSDFSSMPIIQCLSSDSQYVHIFVQNSLSRIESSSKIWVDMSTCRRLGDNWALGVIIINRDFYFRALGSLVVLSFPQLVSFSSVFPKPLSETLRRSSDGRFPLSWPFPCWRVGPRRVGPRRVGLVGRVVWGRVAWGW